MVQYGRRRSRYFRNKLRRNVPATKRPPGTYELRLGYTALESRGIGQVYVDGIPKASPWTCASSVTTEESAVSTTGGLAGETKMKTQAVFTQRKSWKKTRIMKNNGYYSAPKSVFFGNDGNDIPRYNASNCTLYYNSCNLLRRKICTVEVKANTHHTRTLALRIDQ